MAIATQVRHQNRTAALCQAFGLEAVVVTAPEANKRLTRVPRRWVRERLAEAWALVLITWEAF